MNKRAMQAVIFLLFVLSLFHGSNAEKLKYFQSHLIQQEKSYKIQYIGPGLCDISAKLQIDTPLRPMSYVEGKMWLICSTDINSMYGEGSLKVDNITLAKVTDTKNGCRFAEQNGYSCPIKAYHRYEFYRPSASLNLLAASSDFALPLFIGLQAGRAVEIDITGFTYKNGRKLTLGRIIFSMDFRES